MLCNENPSVFIIFGFFLSMQRCHKGGHSKLWWSIYQSAKSAEQRMICSMYIRIVRILILYNAAWLNIMIKFAERLNESPASLIDFVHFNLIMLWLNRAISNLALGQDNRKDLRDLLKGKPCCLMQLFFALTSIDDRRLEAHSNLFWQLY